MSSYAVAFTLENLRPDLDRAFQSVLSGYLSRSDSETELHLKDLFDGRKRSASAFRGLSAKQLGAFLLHLAGEIRQYCPFAVVVVRRYMPHHDKATVLRDDLGEGLARITELIALEVGWLVGSSTLLLDRGDGVQPLRPRARDKGWSTMGSGPEISQSALLSDPTYRIVDSTAHRLVQVADFAGYVTGRLMTTTEKIAAQQAVGSRPDAKLMTERRLMYKICGVLNLEIACIFQTAQPDDMSHWELRSLATDSREMFAAVEIALAGKEPPVTDTPFLSLIRVAALRNRGLGGWRALAV